MAENFPSESAAPNPAWTGRSDAVVTTPDPAATRRGVKRSVVVLFILLTCGCSTVKKDIHVKTYVQVMDRVDQQVDGNAGYLMGQSDPLARPKVRSTRDIYVLEIIQDPPEIGNDSKEPSMRKPVPEAPRPNNALTSESRRPTAGVQQNFTFGDLNKPANDAAVPLPSEYTVQEKDTLQKISKKFYDSYRQWPRIYEVNKDRINDPNRIVPGTVLTIPAIE